MRVMIDGTATGPFGRVDSSFLVKVGAVGWGKADELKLELKDRLPGMTVHVGQLCWIDEFEYYLLIGVVGAPPFAAVLDVIEHVDPLEIKYRDGAAGSWHEWKYEECA
jgi:hypothetical protein